MGSKKNKQNFLVQGTILAVAAIVAKIIGMIYRIPLSRILGDEAYSYYGTANEIYTILLMISTFSLPLAVSKMVSEKVHLGEWKNAQKIFRCSMKFALVSGAVMSILCFLLADVITGTIMKVGSAAYALRVLSLAIFLFAVTGVLRGFFQGHETMVPTAVSQVVEQIVHAVVSIVLAGVLLNFGRSLDGKDETYASALGAAGATAGTVAGVLVALIMLLFVYVSFQKSYRRRMKSDTTKHLESDRDIYYAIIMTILPVILSTLIYNISPSLDQGIFNNILAAQGYTSQQYNTIYGIYLSKYRVLMNVPLALASSLSPSVVPTLTAAMVDGNYKDARLKVRSTMRYTMILTIPCAVGMAALAHPIMALIYNDWRDLPAGIMQAGALMIVLFAISTLSTAVLQGIGRMKEPVINSAISLVIHVIVLVILLKQFRLNIYGVIYANTLFAFIICILNGLSIRRHLRYRQELRKTFLIPLLASAVMGVAAYVIHYVINSLMNILFVDWASNAVATLLAILAGATIYVFLLIRLRGIRESEIAGLPKGEFMVRVLHKIHFL